MGYTRKCILICLIYRILNSSKHSHYHLLLHYTNPHIIYRAILEGIILKRPTDVFCQGYNSGYPMGSQSFHWWKNEAK